MVGSSFPRAGQAGALRGLEPIALCFLTKNRDRKAKHVGVLRTKIQAQRKTNPFPGGSV